MQNHQLIALYPLVICLAAIAAALAAHAFLRSALRAQDSTISAHGLPSEFLITARNPIEIYKLTIEPTVLRLNYQSRLPSAQHRVNGKDASAAMTNAAPMAPVARY